VNECVGVKTVIMVVVKKRSDVLMILDDGKREEGIMAERIIILP